MLRKTAAVIFAIILGGIVIFFMHGIGHQFYPPPVDGTPEAQMAFLRNAPEGLYFFIVLSYIVGAFFTGLFATLITKGIEMNEALIAGLVITFLSFINLLSFSGPWWFWVLALIVHIPMALLGHKVAAKLKRKRLTM